MPESILESLRIKADKNLIPINALLELTHKCNLSCIHCYIIKDQRRKELTTSRIKKLIGELRNKGCLYITLTGGEPLLHPDFFKICSAISSANIALQIFTNGTLLTDKLIRELNKLNINGIALSLYGATAQTHDGITRVKGSFRKTIKSALSLKKANLHPRFKYIMMNKNMPEFNKMLKISRDLGIPYDLDPVITPCENGDMSLTKLRLDDKSLKSIYSKLNSNIKYKISNIKFDSCSFGKSLCAINAYGDVYPCIQLPISAGNVLQKPFSGIWDKSPLLKEARSFSVNRIHSCNRCKLLKYCHICPGISYMEEGSLYSPSKEACRHARIVKEIITQRI
jgi:radical SAM protein with 4Fe4S-binding SPASM domain